MIPLDEQIDLMVLSHSDTDHIATADHILATYDVKKVIWSGFERPDTDQWVDLNEAIDNETAVQVISDSSGDDDIMIRLTKEANVVVEYVEAN